MNRLVYNILGIRFIDIAIVAVAGTYMVYYYWSGFFYQYIGIPFICIGFGFWISGVVHLGKAFHGLPRANKLVTTGIYSTIRHPVYIGSVLVFSGISIITLHLWVVAATILLFFIQFIRSRIENCLLEQHFGHKYEIYKRKTLL